MGYTTNLSGSFSVTPVLSAAHVASLAEFADQDHRGEEGVPRNYCQWRPTPDGTAIEWDGEEKFYDYVEWLKYLIETFLKPWDHKLNGEVKWDGEDPGDHGVIRIKDNEVRSGDASLVFPSWEDLN